MIEILKNSIVSLELLCSGLAILWYVQEISIGRRISPLLIPLICLLGITSLWFYFGAEGHRWLGLKAVFFFLCVYLASRNERLAIVLLISAIVLKGFLYLQLSDIFTQGKYIFPRFGFLVLLFLLLNKGTSGKSVLLNVALVVGWCWEMNTAFQNGARGVMIGLALAALVIYSRALSRLALHVLCLVPFFYIIVMSSMYLAFLNNWIFPETIPGSVFGVIERSSMIYSAINQFFDYFFLGPGRDFDNDVGYWMTLFDLVYYDSMKGVDPHSYFLSLWRDEGALITILWVAVWFFYWSQVRSLTSWVGDFRIRLIISLTILAVIEFTVSPPYSAGRLFVSLILGLILGIAYSKTTLLEPSMTATEVSLRKNRA